MSLFFFFNDMATTEIYTLSLHDALPICRLSPGPSSRRNKSRRCLPVPASPRFSRLSLPACWPRTDRKSTRLNSSHLVISYAVFCLKKKKKLQKDRISQIRKQQHDYTQPR